jgi:chitodextrinase
MCGTKKASTSATSYACKSLSPGRTYNFTVKAFDMAGNCSPSSNTIYADTTADIFAPTIPYGLKASSITETEISLIWSPSSDNVKVKGYEIYCDDKKVGTTSKTIYNCKKLIPGKALKYTIRAVDTSGLQSAESASLTITTLTDLKAPTAPESLKISSVNRSTISLSWNASTDNIKVKGYKLYCNGSVIATTTRTKRSARKPSGLGLGVYWVRAYDQSDNLSEKSNIVTFLAG